MTTGTKGSPPPIPYGLGLGHYRDWTGGDGKWTNFAGQPADKWNNYTCVQESWVRTTLSFLVTWLAIYPNGLVTRQTTQYQTGFAFKADKAWTTNNTYTLYSRLLKKIKGHDFNLAVNAGQLHQTVDLLAGNLSKLGRAALALKRGNFSLAARQLGVRPKGTRLKTTDISGRWLELQYGWLPLIGDSYQAALAFAAISEGPRSQTYRASFKHGWIGNGSQSPTITNVPYRAERRRSIIYECTEEMGFARQLGMLDPLSVAWELMPWSFVIDWFIPFGAYLDLVNQIPNLKGRFLTTEVIVREGMQGEPSLLPGWYTLGAPSYKSQVEAVLVKPALHHKKLTMTRTYSDSLPLPLPQCSLFGVVQGKKLWNAISLAQQRFARDPGTLGKLVSKTVF
jgi:hypothetical protein